MNGPTRVDFVALMWDMLAPPMRSYLCIEAGVDDQYTLLYWHEVIPHVQHKIGEAVVRLAQQKREQLGRAA